MATILSQQLKYIHIVLGHSRKDLYPTEESNNTPSLDILYKFKTFTQFPPPVPDGRNFLCGWSVELLWNDPFCISKKVKDTVGRPIKEYEDSWNLRVPSFSYACSSWVLCKSSSYVSCHHLGVEVQDEVWIPSECYNHSTFSHLLAVFQQKSTSVGQEGFLN